MFPFRCTFHTRCRYNLNESFDFSTIVYELIMVNLHACKMLETKPFTLLVLGNCFHFLFDFGRKPSGVKVLLWNVLSASNHVFANCGEWKWKRPRSVSDIFLSQHCRFFIYLFLGRLRWEHGVAASHGFFFLSSSVRIMRFSCDGRRTYSKYMAGEEREKNHIVIFI